MEPSVSALRHVTRRMGGRDRHETHRVATPLELLFDLTFATSFGLAASHYADALCRDQLAPFDVLVEPVDGLPTLSL